MTSVDFFKAENQTITVKCNLEKMCKLAKFMPPGDMFGAVQAVLAAMPSWAGMCFFGHQGSVLGCALPHFSNAVEGVKSPLPEGNLQ